MFSALLNGPKRFSKLTKSAGKRLPLFEMSTKRDEWAKTFGDFMC